MYTAYSAAMVCLSQAFKLYWEVDQAIKDIEWDYHCTDHNVSGLSITGFTLPLQGA